MEISNIRLKELKKAEAKLNALEAGGVDNWHNYEYALEGYFAETRTQARHRTTTNISPSSLTRDNGKGNEANENTRNFAGSR